MLQCFKSVRSALTYVIYEVQALTYVTYEVDEKCSNYMDNYISDEGKYISHHTIIATLNWVGLLKNNLK